MLARVGACAVEWQLIHAEARLSTGPFSRPSTPRCAFAYAGAAGLIQDSVSGSPPGSLPHIRPTGTIFSHGELPAIERSKAYVAKYHPVAPARSSLTAMSICSSRTSRGAPPAYWAGSATRVRAGEQILREIGRLRGTVEQLVDQPASREPSSWTGPVCRLRASLSTRRARRSARRARRNRRRRSCERRPCCRPARRHRRCAPASCRARPRARSGVLGLP